jgi:cytochrome c oxidase subunit IV
MTTAQPKLATYLIIYALLLVGLVATVGVAYLPLGPWNLLTALAIAFAKATLVVLVFMHVRYSPRLTWIAVFAGLIWLALLLTLTFADYSTRRWTEAPLPDRLPPVEGVPFDPPREGSSTGHEGAPHAEQK